eukprot:403368368
MTLIYKLDNAPPVVQSALDELGWHEFDEDEHQPEQWNLFWKTTRPTMGEFKSAKQYQKHIHFPKTGMLTTKDNLCRLMKKMKTIFGPVYNFSPTTFILPNEYKKFVEQFTKSDEKQIWICKPADLSRGRKIFLISDIGELQYDQQSIIQKYIANPLLIKGYKWDMRIYVLVTQARPLKFYLYKEGIVRFSSEKYDTSTIKNVYSHLTNSSINKFAANVNIMSGGAFGSGIKWNFSQLRSYLKVKQQLVFNLIYQDQGINYEKLWVRIESIIILTVINLASQMPDLDCCFELFGFDIMVDQQLKPWLIEVNSSPAMSMDSNIDYQIKPDLIKDIIRLLSFEPYEQFLEKQKKKYSLIKQMGSNNFFKKRIQGAQKATKFSFSPNIRRFNGQSTINTRRTELFKKRSEVISQEQSEDSKFDSNFNYEVYGAEVQQKHGKR